MSADTYVIVGASLAGAKAAETLRAEGFDGAIVLIGAESERPYERPPLSKDILLGKADRNKAFVHEPGWYAEHDVDLRMGSRVTSIDRSARQVRLEDGSAVGYTRLLLATGAAPRRLPVPGADLAGLLYLRTLADSEALLAALGQGGQVVIAGAGWIGLEVAAAARGRGASVTLLEADTLPLRRILGDEVATIFADLHREKGVDLRFGVGVSEIRSEDGAASVVLADGSSVPADLIVVGIGVRPASDLAEAAGIAVDRGVLVDAALQTSAPDVYAAGDVAAVDHAWLPGRIHVEHWANALASGPAAAKSMAGQQVSYDVIPFFFSDQYDLGMEYAGYVGPDGYDEVVFRGDVGAREFIAFYVKDGRLIAGLNANVWDVSDKIQAVIRAGKPVDSARLADPEVALEDLA